MISLESPAQPLKAASHNLSTRIHDFPPRRVYIYVSKLPLLLCVLGIAVAAAPDTRLDPLLHSVENHYNRAQSLKLDFTESYSVARRPAQIERGVLFLRKPGKMRWDYAAPAGKVFLSDGKNVLFYTPDNHRLVKSKLKESEDLRAPLAFLLGKLNFWKEFRSFSSRPEGDSMWVTAIPTSDQSAYTQVEFLVAPDATIRRVRITGQDRSVLDFTFSNEQVNAPVIPSMFAFTPPPGTETVMDNDNAEKEPVKARP
jgi:outer membrane lipoprotein carrier protein